METSICGGFNKKDRMNLIGTGLMGKSMRKTKLPNEGPGHLKSLVWRLWSAE